MKDIIKQTLDKYKDANMSSEQAREQISEQIMEDLNEWRLEGWYRVKNPPYGVRHYNNRKTQRTASHAPYLYDDEDY